MAALIPDVRRDRARLKRERLARSRDARVQPSS